MTTRRRARRVLPGFLLAAATLACGAAALAQSAAPAGGAALAPLPGADTSFAHTVESRQPPFYDGGIYTRIDYVPLDRASGPWEICATIPPAFFEYFRAIRAGLEAEAARQGVRLDVQATEDFDPAAQIRHLERCIAGGADALVVVAVRRGAFGDLFAMARARGIPVIDLATGSGDPGVTARIVSDRVDVGRAAGRFLAERYPAGGIAARVAWLYGPTGSVIADEVDLGFRSGIASGAVQVVHAETIALDEDSIRQATRRLLSDTDVTFEALVGGAATVAIAAEEIAAAGTGRQVELVSVTTSSAMVAGIEEGTVFAAVNDRPVAQARIAVDLAVRAIEGLPHLRDLRPSVEIVDRGNIAVFDRATALPPPD